MLRIYPTHTELGPCIISHSHINRVALGLTVAAGQQRGDYYN